MTYYNLLFACRPQPLGGGLAPGNNNNKFSLDDKRNRFQFLKQDLDSELGFNALKGSGQSGDDYSYSPHGKYGGSHGYGYDYQPPT